MPIGNKELHRTGRIGCLRAAVLGANDGILSTSSLVSGVAAAHETHSIVLVAAVTGLVPGSMSMAAGEYVSVRSQAVSASLTTILSSAFPARLTNRHLRYLSRDQIQLFSTFTSTCDARHRR